VTLKGKFRKKKLKKREKKYPRPTEQEAGLVKNHPRRCGEVAVSFKWINQLDAAINYRCIVCRLDTAQHVSGILMPIIRNLSTAAAASGLPPRSYGKPEAAAAVDRHLMMGTRMPEIC